MNKHPANEADAPSPEDPYERGKSEGLLLGAFNERHAISSQVRQIKPPAGHRGDWGKGYITARTDIVKLIDARGKDGNQAGQS